MLHQAQKLEMLPLSRTQKAPILGLQRSLAGDAWKIPAGSLDMPSMVVYIFRGSANFGLFASDTLPTGLMQDYGVAFRQSRALHIKKMLLVSGEDITSTQAKSPDTEA